MSSRSTGQGPTAARAVAGALTAGVLALVGAGVARAARFTPQGADVRTGRFAGSGTRATRPQDEAVRDDPASYAVGTAERLSALVRIPTVSSRVPGEEDPAVFEAFVERLAELYPRVHERLTLERVAGHGLLFRWRGRQGAAPAAPAVLMAHYDVVPVEAEDWSGDPFSGAIRDGAVWGRGTLDDKGSLVVLLEAVESLLAQRFTPDRDVYLSFGHNEETAGDAARSAVAVLRERKISPWLVVDEGGAVVEGAFPGVTAPTAVVGVAEKGILDLEISTQSLGGHASTPVRGGATARLARAITRIDDHPFPPHLPEPTLEMIDTLGRHSPFGLRLLFASARQLRPALARVLGTVSPETNAMVRTTVAITQLQGSPGANVLAASAKANANVRIATGETVATVVERLRRVVDDPTIELRVVSGEDPSPVSPTDGDQFALVRESIGAAYPDAVVTPYVMLGASDSRHFCEISEHVYRFSPFAMTREQRESIHGVDEHVTIDALGRGVVFYRALLRGL
ncbi:M20/M25/M40 family metallo-hydrolase [Oerskovia sp. NPDC060287]|uniref:M20/M25/M40 family metallo-hydrolase n=1 Tax=Oerskovia sp. NPDC060287 TaxID=3347095 RepID=UPI00365F2928